MPEKKEERIVDKPTKKEVKKLIEKAEKVAKEPQKKDSQEKKPVEKIDLILSKLGTLKNTLTKYTKKTDTIETLLSNKDSQEQKEQTKKSSAETLAEVQAEQDKEKAQGKKQPGQQLGQAKQLTEEQYQKMSNDEKVPLLEAQLRTQQGNPNNYGKIMQGINAISPVVIEAMRQNKSNSGSIGSFFENLKIYSGVENAMLGNVFRFFKFLNPTQQRQGAQNIIQKGAQLPDFPELPPINEAHIGE